jgi:transcriptional regulator with PAS, ATPase and Fis domain
MEKGFGLSRVLEPVGSLPVIAWKLDNSREIATDEARISVERIQVEAGSFQQVCSQCGYDETKMKQRFIDLVEKRGKFHNPYTDSGGNFYGKVEAMGREYEQTHRFKVGDDFFDLVTTTAIPMHIEEIKEIDFNYRQLIVSGYAIVFESTYAYDYLSSTDLKYAMLAVEESGTLHKASQIVRDNTHVCIIGNDPMTTVMYVKIVRRYTRNVHITLIFDHASCNGLPEDVMAHALTGSADEIVFIDVRKPMDAYEAGITSMGKTDLVINCEDKAGAETLSILLCRDNGSVCFTRMSGNYTTSILIAESMQKKVNTIDMEPYFENYNVFTREILEISKPDMDMIAGLYRQYDTMQGVSAETAAYVLENRVRQIGDFVYGSSVTEELVENVINVAKYDCNVIIQGETGVGKEKVLELIHNNSARKEQPCIRVNCATIQESLAESEFFGYEAGAFTGAGAGGKVGYFELANNGILFLDEIGTLSMNMQSKLLRVLQESQFYRVGGTRQITVNVRVICANNVSLQQLIADGRFREDLYYRLNICEITVPPLRERKDDIFVLARTFLAQYNKKYALLKEITQDGYTALAAYNWPGNVRELENTVHRLIINSTGNVITGLDVETMLNRNIYGSNVLDAQTMLQRDGTIDLDKVMEAQEKKLVEYALGKLGTTRKAAEALGINQTKLMRKKRKYGL